MLIAIAAFIAGFVAIPLVDNVTWWCCSFADQLRLLGIFDGAESLVCRCADIERKGARFLAELQFLNIGWTVGPPIGTLLVMYSLQLPFWLAAFAPRCRWSLSSFTCKKRGADTSQKTTPWQPSVLLKDRALFWYTLSGLLASYVGGSFASCISQYVLAANADSDFAQVVAVVLPVNAAVVVTLQYAWAQAASGEYSPLNGGWYALFVLGLGGFMFSGENLVYWGSRRIFTLGEIIYAPGEYMLIDNIAPPGMKASYFSAQALGWLARRQTR
jgi:hypothetical protein